MAGELHADELRHLELPLHAHQAIDQVSAAHADREHTEAARSRRVAVGDEHHAAREVVVLEENLVANARARRPEVKAVALGSAGEEIVRFVVRLIGNLQVRNRTRVGHHQVVTDDRSGQRNAVLARRKELNNGHRAANVVRACTIRAEFDVVSASLIFAHFFGMIEMRVEDFFRKRKRVAEMSANRREFFGIFAVEGFDHVEVADVSGLSSGLECSARR